MSAVNEVMLTFVLILVAITTTDCKPSVRRDNPFQQQFTTRKIHSHDIVQGNPDISDILLLNITIIKEKIPGRVIYEDLVFDEQLYSDDSLSGKICPYNITGISLLHQEPDSTSGYPVIVTGGVGSTDATLLFVSKKNEGINYWVRIWGRPFEVENQNYNLLQGIPGPSDELLMYTNLCEVGEYGETVTGSVVYDTPENKVVNITSVQAWDISKGCELGSYPVVTEGGVGFDHVKIEITSPLSRGFQYHIVVIGEIKKKRINAKQFRGIQKDV